MSILSRLFGGGASKPGSGPAPVEYEGFLIHPAPIRDGSKHRISARIEKEVGGEKKSHTLIRADTLDDHDAAVDASVAKARKLIDEQGDRLFD
jgi:hypothetical protein